MSDRNPWMDPFFSPAPQNKESTTDDTYGEYRAFLREQLQTTANKVSKFFIFWLKAWFLFAISCVPLAIIFTFAMGSSKASWDRLLGGLVISAILVGLPLVIWWRNRQVAKAIEHLANALGGSWSQNSLLPVLDWLDAHWRTDHPREILESALPIVASQWEWQTTFAGRNVLLIAQRREGASRTPGSASPTVERMSLFLTGSKPSDEPDADTTAILQELDKLGYWVKRTSAGVYATQAGISPERFEPSKIKNVLDLMARIR